MPTEMTMRDHFAAAALTGLLARSDVDADPLEHHFCCEDAYKWADFMLRERGNRQAALDSSTVTKPMPKEKRAEVSAKPVAWAVMDGHEFMEFCTDKEEAKCAAGFYGDCPIVPLYRQPQPTLTDAEREAVEVAIRTVDWTAQRHPHAATLRGLLERLK